MSRRTHDSPSDSRDASKNETASTLYGAGQNRSRRTRSRPDEFQFHNNGFPIGNDGYVFRPRTDGSRHNGTAAARAGGTAIRSMGDCWQAYRSFVRKHQMNLHLWDEAITHLLFWTPHSTGESTTVAHRWREVLYGLLSLHRMAMGVASQHAVENSYGTTLRPEQPTIAHPTAIRMALTVTHGLMPTFLELSRSDRGGYESQRRLESVRLYIERIKFMLRIILLASYWRQLFQDPIEPEEEATVVSGLLRDDGMYIPEDDCEVPTAQQERARLERQQYVGRRTGRRLRHVKPPRHSLTPTQQKIRLVLGELLHAYRPLYWAHAERRQTKHRQSSQQVLWLSWMVALGMDLASLRCLSTVVSDENSLSQTELKRRRMKIFLYLLRAPVWDRLTHPSVQRLVSLIQRVPLLGRLVETYLWDWLLYWKHPFFLEEG